ncbi:hypothetical protein D3C79_901210 [compost metagenome]
MVVDIGDQSIQLGNEMCHLRRGVSRLLGFAQPWQQSRLPVAVQCLKLFGQLLLRHRVLQIRAVGILVQLADQCFTVCIQRHLRQQAVTLHPQRPGFVDGMRVALNAL